MLRNLDFKPRYNSDYDSLLNDFFIPALKQAYTYDRAVSYFSSKALIEAAEGLSIFVKNKGKIRLIINTFINIDDYDALNIDSKKDEIIKKYGLNIQDAYEKFNDDLSAFRIECLSWLVANGQLEIKVAYRKFGIFHWKEGIIRDKQNSVVVFNGSMNETESAMNIEKNGETISVFSSWLHDNEKKRCEEHSTEFDDLWNNRFPRTKVMPLSRIDREYFIEKAKNIRKEDLSEETEIRLSDKYIKKYQIKKPQIPSHLNGSKFRIHEHQRDALNEWKSSNYQGIFELATGTGKTITSIFGAVKIFEATKKLCLVVSVPYLSLAEQWVDELRKFQIIPIRCFETHKNWESNLQETIKKFNSDLIDFFAIVVVNATMITTKYQNLIGKISKKERIFFIGDECHHHGSEYFNQKLPKEVKYKLGLSATPEHYINEDHNDRLVSYYGKSVYKYTLEKAIKDNILCKYEYNLININLTFDEQEEYRELSKRISQRYAISGGKNDNIMNSLIRRRTRLIGNAENKIIVLNNILKSQKPEPYTLFYCGEGIIENEENEIEYTEEDNGDTMRQIEIVSEIISNHNWRSSRFTNREPRNIKPDILNNFKNGTIDALVAMRCLDEGIDIPLCKTAYIIASSNNPRQFIQRRGRILRKHPKKEKAVINDFFVSVPMIDASNVYDTRHIRNEIRRVNEFSKLSMNYAQTYNTIRPILLEYGLEEMV
jgi:superfamily II DNA or RNA helicase